jgi:hypothetical protein
LEEVVVEAGVWRALKEELKLFEFARAIFVVVVAVVVRVWNREMK